MKLMTKEIQKKARAQYPQGSSLDQLVVAKFFDPCSQWTWYLMNQDPNDPNYLWGIVKGFEIEEGSFSLNELSTFKNKFGLGIERDMYFRPKSAKEIYEKLKKGIYV